METQKRIITTAALLLVLVTAINAQKIWEDRKGCLRTQGNLAGGYLFQQKQVGGYVTGDADLFVDSRVSVGGSVWFSFALNHKDQPGIKANHAILSTVSYHFVKKGRWDPYIGFNPGLGLVSAAYLDGDELKKTSISPVPLLSASIGCNYYIGSIFNFFVKVQGVSGQMFTDVPKPVRLEEVKFTAGLGWNFRVWKPKKS